MPPPAPPPLSCASPPPPVLHRSLVTAVAGGAAHGGCGLASLVGIRMTLFWTRSGPPGAPRRTAVTPFTAVATALLGWLYKLQARGPQEDLGTGTPGAHTLETATESLSSGPGPSSWLSQCPQALLCPQRVFYPHIQGSAGCLLLRTSGEGPSWQTQAQAGAG